MKHDSVVSVNKTLCSAASCCKHRRRVWGARGAPAPQYFWPWSSSCNILRSAILCTRVKSLSSWALHTRPTYSPELLLSWKRDKKLPPVTPQQATEMVCNKLQFWLFPVKRFRLYCRRMRSPCRCFTTKDALCLLWLLSYCGCSGLRYNGLRFSASAAVVPCFTVNERLVRQATGRIVEKVWPPETE